MAVRRLFISELKNYTHRHTHTHTQTNTTVHSPEIRATTIPAQLCLSLTK